MNSKKIISILLFLYVLSILIFDNVRYVKLVYITDVLMVGYFLIYKLLNKKLVFEFNYFFLFLFLFCILSLASLFWTPNINGASIRVLSLFFILINTFIIYHIIKEFNNLNYIFYAFFIFIILNFLILNGFLGHQEYYYYGFRFQGTTGNPNLVAIYSVFTIFISLFLIINNNKNKVYILFLYLIISFSFILIIYTGSKKGIIFSIFLILIYVLINLELSKKLLKRLVILLFIVPIVGYIIINNFISNDLFVVMEKSFNRISEMLLIVGNENFIDESTRHRIHLINSAFEKFSENPFLGLGILGFETYEGVYAHNNYMEILANLGIIGFFIYYMIYIVIFFKILSIDSKILQFYFFSTLIIMLLMDVALVSYFSKIYFIILISIFYLSNNKTYKDKYEKN